MSIPKTRDPPTTPAKIFIVILNWRNWQDTIACAESVLRNRYPKFQTIIVDNDSQNGSMEYIKEWAEGLLQAPRQPPGPMNHLVFPPAEKPIRYVEHDRVSAERGEK